MPTGNYPRIKNRNYGSSGKHWKWSEENKKKIKGRVFSEGTREKLSEKMSGENHWNWKKDRTQLCRINKQGERRTSAYFYWRKQVWERDNFKCKINNQDCSGKIIAHHILGWSQYPELRYEINNGITLCLAHHPRKRAEEKRLIFDFQGLVAVSKEPICH